MQLLVFILKKIEVENQLITELAEAGITGGTILTGTGMATAMLDLDSLPIFGLLRQVIGDQERKPAKSCCLCSMMRRLTGLALSLRRWSILHNQTQEYYLEFPSRM